MNSLLTKLLALGAAVGGVVVSVWSLLVAARSKRAVGQVKAEAQRQVSVSADFYRKSETLTRQNEEEGKQLKEEEGSSEEQAKSHSRRITSWNIGD